MTLHDQGFGSRGSLAMIRTRPMMRPSKRATPSVPGSESGKVHRQSRASTRNERLALSARAKTSSHYHRDNANSGPAGARGVIPRATKTTTSSCIPRQKRGLPAPAFVDDAAKTTGKHRATVSRDATGLFPPVPKGSKTTAITCVIVVHGSGRHRARRNARDDCHSAKGDPRRLLEAIAEVVCQLEIKGYTMAEIEGAVAELLGEVEQSLRPRN